MLKLEDFFFPNFAKSFPAQFHCWNSNFFRFSFNSFSLYGFSADSPRKKPPFNAKGICTVRNVTHFFSPSAPYAVSTVDSGIFSAFERLTCGRTRFWLGQHMYTFGFINKTLHCVGYPLKDILTRFNIKFFLQNSLFWLYLTFAFGRLKMSSSIKLDQNNQKNSDYNYYCCC